MPGRTTRRVQGIVWPLDLAVVAAGVWVQGENVTPCASEKEMDAVYQTSCEGEGNPTLSIKQEPNFKLHTIFRNTRK